MKKLLYLSIIIFFSSLSTTVFADMSEDISKAQEEAKAIKHSAEALGDKELKAFASDLEQMLELQAKCAKESQNDEFKFGICLVGPLKELADKGNVVAQHGLGNFYEGMGEIDKAILWYQKALDNPKTLEFYKPEIQADMDRAKAAKN